MRNVAVFVMAGMAWCGVALGGPLASEVNHYFDGTTHWCGTAAFDSGAGLNGTIDYCVYQPNMYPAGGDYTPTPNEFVYAYQVYVTGSVPAVLFSVGMLDSNEANNLSDDLNNGQLGGDDPDLVYWTGSDPNLLAANWEWTTAGLTTYSDVLVYSSINAPLWYLGSIQDGGQGASALVPSPSDVIPEPAALSLLALGVVAVLRRKR